MSLNELTLKKEQWINKPIDEVFAFFAEAKNLERITPPQLNFKILKTSTEDIQRNTLIDYKLKLYGVPFKWKTLISEYKANEMFIDEQLKGPYKKWVHTHSFIAKDNGTLILDEVKYEIPLGSLGKVLLKGIIQKELDKIFGYRQEIIAEIFNSPAQ